MGQPASMKTVPKPPRRLPPPRNPMYAIKLKNGWTPVDAMKDKIRVHVAKLCDNCPDFLCVLQGNIQQMGGATPDSTSIIATTAQIFCVCCRGTFNRWVVPLQIFCVCCRGTFN